MADRQTDDFKLGNKAADMWLYTADACANEKVIPKKYRYTTGTALMNGAEAICSCIEGANLIDLRERPAERLAMQREALCACKKLERKILRMAESKQYPGVSGQKAATWSKAVMTVRYMCAAWYEKDRTCAPPSENQARMCDMTYQELCSFDTLWTAYHRARRCKRGKKSTAPFEYSAIEELLILSKSLLQGTHQPDPLDAFYIYEPKKRLIQAPTFRDKVVQHALTDYIVYDELARSFTLNTYAAQYGKGTHYGLEMLKRHMRTYFLRRKGTDEATRKAAGLPHRPVEEWDYAEGWVIKGDIRHFFQSIDHRRLKAALEPRFPDPDIRALMWRYIDAVDEGLALGHQTSHIYAVFYVSSFMHYVGEKLHLPLAGMYMDDWYVICPDKATAVEALRLARLEFAKLGLELNDKTNIFPLQNGIDFCGFHTYLTRTGQVVSKLRYSSIKRMKRRIRLWEKQYAAGEVSREKIMESFTAWEAHAKHGDTKQLRREMRSRLLMALDRADEARRAAGIPAARPGPDERRTKRYGTVTFQSGKRQPGEAGGKQQAHQVHQAGQ